MKLKIIFFLLVLALFLTGCLRDKTATDYSAYNQPQGPNNPSVGGGCGVAPANDYSQPEIGSSSPTL